MTFQEGVDLHQIRINTDETRKFVKAMNDKMDKQIALLEKMVEILTEIEERHTDDDY